MNSIVFDNEDLEDERMDELAFLLPHIYGDLVGHLLNRKEEKLRELKSKKKAEERSQAEKDEIEEFEQSIVRLKTVRIQLSKKSSMFGADDAMNMARSVSIRRVDLVGAGGDDDAAYAVAK